MFWVAVCKIGFAWCPSDIELFHPVFQPPTLTVTPFASLLLDSTLCKPFCCDVVSLDSSWWLRMLECVETIFYGDEFMCVHVNGYHFRLSCTAHDAFNGIWEDMNWCIELSVVRGPKKDVACCSASGIWNDIKGSVWLSLKDHVTCPAPDFWCWIACCAFQDMLSGLPGLLWYALWHLVSQIVECMQQGVIHFLSYEEELSDDSLDKFGLLLCWWCTVVIFNTLDLGSMVDAWWFWWTFEVLFWFSCFQFAQCILNALIHWANDFTSVMIPVQMHPCALLHPCHRSWCTLSLMSAMGDQSPLGSPTQQQIHWQWVWIGWILSRGSTDLVWTCTHNVHILQGDWPHLDWQSFRSHFAIASVTNC